MAQRGAHRCRWEVFLARAQCLMTKATVQLRVLQAPAGDLRPSWQETRVPLKDHQVRWALRSLVRCNGSGLQGQVPLSEPRPLPVPFEWEQMAGLRVGQAEATSVRLDNMGWSLSPHTCDMTSRDQLSVMEMGWLGLAGSLLSFSEGRRSVGPKTVARLCRDILFTVSFSATLRRAEVEGTVGTLP